MQRKTNLSDKTGRHCNICIGCGRCISGKKDIHVLTHSGKAFGEASVKEVSLRNARKERLVTVDIGTTTIAMELYDEEGRVADTFVCVNPQTSYGADVLSRIAESEKPEAAERMRQMLLAVLTQGLEQFRASLNTVRGERLRMVIAANTTMVYLLMGWETQELGEAPFLASHLEGVETVIDGVECHIFPGASAFVGGDIVSGVYACEMAEKEELTLFIDLGTNGELVLGNRDRMLACSTAAGPAFEGGVNRGVWGADMIRLLAVLCDKGIVDETGLLAEPYFETGVRIGDVCVTQKSIRAIQLAKAAVAAGIKILVGEYGAYLEQIDRVILSGGFGYYLSPQAAGRIGLLPQALVSKTTAGGNTALAGALRLGRLLLAQTEKPIESSWETLPTDRLQTMNLAQLDGFNEIYMNEMNLCESAYI